MGLTLCCLRVYLHNLKSENQIFSGQVKLFSRNTCFGGFRCISCTELTLTVKKKFVSLKKCVADGGKLHSMSGFGYSESSVCVLGFSLDEGSTDNKIIATLSSNLASKEFFCGAAAGA